MAHAVIKLTDIIRAEQLLELSARTKQEALAELSAATAGDPRVSDHTALERALLNREAQASTGIGLGLAIPHAKIPQVSDNLLVIGRSRAGIAFDALDGAPVHLLFMIASSDKHTREFVRLLAAVTHVLKDDALREKLVHAEMPGPFLELMRLHEHG